VHGGIPARRAYFLYIQYCAFVPVCAFALLAEPTRLLPLLCCRCCARADALAFMDNSSTIFVPTTEHSQHILRKPLSERTHQDTEYLKSFLQQFRPFVELSPEGLEQAVLRMTFERPKPGAAGEHISAA
jgi:hypothetical protein